MAISTVKLNGETLLTVNDTTAVTSDVASGKTFTLANGTKGTGSATSSGVSIIETDDPGGGTIITVTGEEIPYSLPPKQVNFVDYDGRILYAYTGTQTQNLTALPSNPSHTGLTAQGWNWTLAQIKAQLTASPNSIIWVGQQYVTSSGDTEIDIEIIDQSKLDPSLVITVDGSVTVNWGDGSTATTVTGNDIEERLKVQHIYNTIGKYTISIHLVSGEYSFNGNSSNPLLRKYSATTYKESRSYAACVTGVRLGSITAQILGSAFHHCYNLKHITMPYNIDIDTSDLFSNDFTPYLTIPQSVTTIGDYMCQTVGMKYISLPPSITTIASYAFYDANGLISITLPEGLITIDESAFYQAYSLSSLIIPSTVTTIGANAFFGCYGVTEFHIKPTTPPTLGAGAFDSNAGDSVIYVPSASLSAYQNAANWSTYASRMVGE